MKTKEFKIYNMPRVTLFSPSGASTPVEVIPRSYITVTAKMVPGCGVEVYTRQATDDQLDEKDSRGGTLKRVTYLGNRRFGVEFSPPYIAGQPTTASAMVQFWGWCEESALTPEDKLAYYTERSLELGVLATDLAPPAVRRDQSDDLIPHLLKTAEVLSRLAGGLHLPQCQPKVKYLVERLAWLFEIQRILADDKTK